MDLSAEAVQGIRQVARDLIAHGIDGLVESSTDLILGEEPTYGDVGVDRADLARETHRTLSLTLHRLAGMDIPEELRGAAFETGLRRAEQGLPLASLLHAFRIDLRLLWDAITQEGRRLGHVERLTVLEQHTLLWEALEANTADVVEAFQVVEARQTQRLNERDRELFKRLLTSGERQVDAVDAFASHAGLPVDGRFAALVLVGLTDPRETATLLRTRLRTSGCRSFVTVYKDDVHCLALERPEQVLPLEAVTGAASDSSAVAVRAHGLSNVPRAFRVARKIASNRGPGALADVCAAPLEQLAALEPELVDVVLDDRLRGLIGLPEAEAEGLWETLEALVAGDGTVSDIATRTFRHRNTVRARIERLRDLTSLDSRVPSDLMIFALAVARRRATTGPRGT